MAQISYYTNWTKDFQKPFDDQMATMPEGPEKNALMQQYLSNIDQYAKINPKIAQGAKDTFNKYYQQAPQNPTPNTPAPEVPQPTMDPAAAAAPATDPWASISQAYGLGAPPSQGLPSTLKSVNMGAAPQATAQTIDLNSIPQPAAQQMQVNDGIKAMAGGQGYSPDTLAKMKANAVDTASNAGVQQMGQTKRILGQAGVKGGAAAAVQSDVARQALQNQGTALNNIDVNNAQVGNENAKFGLGQETSIGQGNMQAANQMALENANKMFSGLQTNQSANQSTNQMNTSMNFQRQNDQANMDYNNQKSQWDELNKRYGQSQNILGSWAGAA